MTHAVFLLRLLRILVFVLFLGGMSGAVQAQPTGSVPKPLTLDKRLFDRVYQIQTPAFRRAMRTANATA